MSTRLDEIEARWSENEQWARDLDLREETIMAEDVRALVAVARAAAYCRSEGFYTDDDEWHKLDAALAPLLEQPSADAGEGRE